MFTTVHYHNPAFSFTRKQNLFFFFFFLRVVGAVGWGWSSQTQSKSIIKITVTLNVKKNIFSFRISSTAVCNYRKKKFQSQIKHQVKLTPDS